MTPDTGNHVAFVTASGTGVATLIMTFFDAHAAGIGAICTLVTCLIYAGMSFIKWRYYSEQRAANSAAH